MMLSRVLVGLLVLATIIIALWSVGLRINLTASLPLGVYRVSSEPPSRGSIVKVCLPLDVAEFALARGYLGPGFCPGGVRPLGKAVLAVEGDVVTLSRNEIRVNGRAVPNSRTVSEDSRGREMPHFLWGSHRLKAGEIWLFSSYHRSAYDSRYFGPIQALHVVAGLRPFWTRRRAMRLTAGSPLHKVVP